MGILDQLLGGLAGGGGNASPMAGVLSSLLSGQQGGAGAGGGLSSLVSSFEQAGLGHLAQSWVGNGANQPVSPGQLESVFGQGQVQSMAGQAGMAPNDFLSQLSQHLPNAVNEATPGGRLPDEGTVSV